MSQAPRLPTAIYFLSVVCTFCLFAQDKSKLQLRSDAPQTVLKWTSKFGGQPTVLLFHSGAVDPSDCAVLSQGLKDLAQDEVAGIVVHGQPVWPCAAVPDGSRIADTDGTLTRSLFDADLRPGSWQVVIVGPDQRVRLIRLLQKAELNQFPRVARKWEGGRQAFILNCGHCHGSDGADMSYASIKTLAGISTRLSAEKIVEGGQNFGAVDLASWAKADVDSLLLYIRGL